MIVESDHCSMVVGRSEEAEGSPSSYKMKKIEDNSISETLLSRKTTAVSNNHKINE